MYRSHNYKQFSLYKQKDKNHDFSPFCFSFNYLDKYDFLLTSTTAGMSRLYLYVAVGGFQNFYYSYYDMYQHNTHILKYMIKSNVITQQQKM